jgi:hypothetical protein
MSQKKSKWLSVSMATVVALLGISGVAKPAIAATAPPFSKSYYMDTVTTSENYDLGCTLGTNVKNTPGTQDNLVVLSYGAPAYLGVDVSNNPIYGSKTYNGSSVSTRQIADAVHAYANGFWICSDTDTTSTAKIVVGTNNSRDPVNLQPGTYSGAGSSWAFMVKQINSELGSYASQVSVNGGIDLEPGFGPPTNADNWVSAYDGVPSAYSFYNYGSADGCPTIEQAIGVAGTCNHGWTQYHMWEFSWDYRTALPLPEIYANTGDNAKQWWSIGVYGNKNYARHMTFAGELTQWGACVQKPTDPACVGANQEAKTGWGQLYDVLNADTRTTSTLQWSTDKLWQYP